MQELQSRLVYLKQKYQQYTEEFSKQSNLYNNFEVAQKQYFYNPSSTTLCRDHKKSVQELEQSQMSLLQYQNEKMEVEKRLQEQQARTASLRSSLAAYEDQIRDVGYKTEISKKNQAENEQKISQMAQELQANSNVVQQIEMEVQQLTVQSNNLEKQLQSKHSTVTTLEKEARQLFQILKSKQNQIDSK